MAPPKKDFYNCAHCGRAMTVDADKDGYHYNVKSDASMHQISCPCGIMTKLCETKGDLQEIWNSKPKKKFVQEKIKITHPAPRGSKNDDEKLTKDGPAPF